MSLAYDRPAEFAVTGKYALVLDQLKDARTALEVGCHTGYFLRVLKDRGLNVYGIDNDPSVSQKASANGVEVATLNVEDPESLKGLGRRFDVIVLMDVLEHLREPQITLTHLRSLLTVKGRLLVTVPNIAYWAVRLKLLRGDWEYQESGILDRTHLRFYNRKGWNHLFESAGYRIGLQSVADAMLPLETPLKRILGKSLVQGKLNPFFSRHFQELLAISFLYELFPSSE